MSFLSTIFLTGLIAAGGPVLIHLLNRRRYKTVQWAAMDFLREALKRNRKIIEIRDILLLVLRTLAILFFVLAMARPYIVSDDARTSSRQPVHAVVLIDNSLSMGFKQLNRTLLDVAKDRAREYIASLPEGSHVSVVPLCNTEPWHLRDVYSNTEDAWEALEEIRVVDRLARATVGIESARRATTAAPDMPSKRVVFFSDMQAQSWDTQNLGNDFGDLKDVQVVNVINEMRDNAWVELLQLRDGVADANSEAVFHTTVRYVGNEPRQNVNVDLLIDGELADSQTIDLLPGQSLDMRFRHTFDVAGTSHQPRFVEATLRLSPDHLEEDDSRSIIVPVIAAVPMVFIDQLGEREDRRLDLYGDTFPLRRLLAPRTGSEEDRRLVQVLHRTVDTVTQQDLEEARLVAIAGVTEPTDELVRLLRAYVQQGGQVFLAAGGEFDPFQWSQIAWLDGAGILPAPLRSDYIGKTPIEDPDVQPFGLAPDSMTDELFHLGLPEGDREALLSMPLIYKAVEVNEDALSDIRETLADTLAEELTFLDQYLQDEQRWSQLEAASELKPEEAAQRARDQERFTELNPTWLKWAAAADLDEVELDAEQRINRTVPRVMGRYTNGHIFGIKRRIGKGRVVMLSTGVFPLWNNIAADYGVLLFDNVLREMLAAGMPQRTLDTPNELLVPVDPADADADFLVHMPGEEDPVTYRPRALDEYRYGFIIRDVARRGVYRIERVPREGESTADATTLSLAVNGPSQESDLITVGQERLTTSLGDADVKLVDVGEQITLEGTTVLGYDMWRWLLWIAIICLAAEMVFLAAPKLLEGNTTT